MTKIFLAIALILAVIFYQKNFSGALPAITPARRDVSEAINKTDFPLSLPAGFEISIFAKDLINPRVLLVDSQGDLLASIPSQGKVVSLIDENKDGISEKTVTVAEGLNLPHGLALRCQGICELYIAESDLVATYDYNPQTKKATNKKKIIDLPGGGGHFTRTIIFNNNKLFTSIGSSCNVCIESDKRRAAIYESNLDGSNFRLFSSGLRNSVFMAVSPFTDDLWATEMGRDLLGDDIPPDEVNIVKEGNYGWPYCYGKGVSDTKMNTGQIDCAKTIPSHIDLQAHSAPLGLSFFQGNGWPESYRGDLLVAYHGSWNRSTPTGYKIVRFDLDEKGGVLGQEDFISGWLSGREALGRPVDILLLDGEGFISDDKAGVIYKIMYTKK